MDARDGLHVTLQHVQPSARLYFTLTARQDAMRRSWSVRWNTSLLCGWLCVRSFDMAIPPTPLYQRNIITFDNLAHPIVLGRRLIIVRHAERVDRCFQRLLPDWLHKMFPNKTTGVYNRINLNVPRRVPLRGPAKDEFNLLDYKSDCPLTTVAEGTAERLGSRLLGSNLKITKVYCSPALRCMQTCNRLLTGFIEAGTSGKEAIIAAKRQYAMNIEPLLFDFTGFSESQLLIPAMLSADFMTDRRMFINKEYKAGETIEALEAGEEIEAFYKRVQRAIDKILKDTEKDAHASILVVSHGPVMDAMCQTLLRQPARSTSMFPKVANYPPYLATMVVEENTEPKSPLKWRLAPPPVKSFTYSVNAPFDWKKLAERR